MENNASAGTRARKIVSIRQFWKYLKNKAHAIDNNVAEDLETPIDVIIENLYVDKVSGKISGERFDKMANRFEAE